MSYLLTIKKLISKNLTKYNKSKEEISYNIVTELIFHKKTHFTSLFVEYLILDDYQEFLSHFYSYNAITSIISHYNIIKKLNPILVDSKGRAILFQNLKKKLNLGINNNNNRNIFLKKYSRILPVDTQNCLQNSKNESETIDNINANNDISISLDLKINKKYDGYILKKNKNFVKNDKEVLKVIKFLKPLYHEKKYKKGKNSPNKGKSDNIFNNTNNINRIYFSDFKNININININKYEKNKNEKINNHMNINNINNNNNINANKTHQNIKNIKINEILLSNLNLKDNKKPKIKSNSLNNKNIKFTKNNNIIKINHMKSTSPKDLFQQKNNQKIKSKNNRNIVSINKLNILNTSKNKKPKPKTGSNSIDSYKNKNYNKTEIKSPKNLNILKNNKNVQNSIKKENKEKIKKITLDKKMISPNCKEKEKLSFKKKNYISPSPGIIRKINFKVKYNELNKDKSKQLSIEQIINNKKEKSFDNKNRKSNKII